MPGSVNTEGVPTPAVNSPAFQHPFATPSPFYNSVASTTVRSPAVSRCCNLVLRSLAFFFSFAAVVALTAQPVHGDDYRRADCEAPSSFRRSPVFRYWISTTILSSLYSAMQLFKGVWEIAFKGRAISDMMSDYATFTLDQMVAYLLLSSSSISALAIQHINPKPFKSVLVVSNCVSFTAFFVIAICTLLSGYKLCKRIIW